MADLSCFATKDNAEEGVVLPVKIDGIKFPMAIRIYGSDSDVVKEYERERIRKRAKKKSKNKDIDEDDIDEILEDKTSVIIRIGGVYTYDWKKKKVVENEPIELFGKVIGNDEESYAYLWEKIPALEDWIVSNSNERGNFLSVGKKN